MKVGEIDNMPLFDSKEEAINYAKEVLNCEGYHIHQYEGKDSYMPCSDHSQVIGDIDNQTYLDDMLDDNKIVYIKVIEDPNEITEKYLKRLSSKSLDANKFYRIVSNPNEASILDTPYRRFRFIYAPGIGAPDLIDTSRDFCVRMMGGRQLVYRYEDIMDLSAQIDAEDTDRKIIPRPKNSGPVDIWTWKGGAGCLHRFIMVVFEPIGYIYNNASEAAIENIMNLPAPGQTGQINMPPNYTGPVAASMAKVGDRGAITKSDKAPKSDTPNKSPKGEGTAKGDAGSTKGAVVTQRVEKILEDKSKDFNERYKEKLGYGANIGALKSVYQRGVGAYNTSHSPEVKSAEQWALARVNAFLYLLKNGRPENSKYVNDNDLLPKKHPKHSENMEAFIEKIPYEKKDDYIQRCVKYHIDTKGMSSEQSYAICVQQAEEDFSKNSKRVILVDIDDTIIHNGKPMMKTLEYIDSKKEDYRIIIISGRPEKRLEETKKELDEIGVYYDEIFLQDFAEETSGEVGKKFKEYKAKKLIDSGLEIVEAIENDEETRKVYDALGINAMNPLKLDLSVTPIGFNNGYALFESKEEAQEYSEFCGCGGLIEETMFKGMTVYQSCSKKKKSSSQLFSANEDKKIIYTPIMLANKLIPRLDDSGEKYFVTFTPESVSRMAYKYLKEKRTDEVNYEHSDVFFDDVYLVESWIVSSKNDKIYDYFTEEQIPIGSWVGAFKIDNDDVWENYIKKGLVKGVSIQGNFIYK